MEVVALSESLQYWQLGGLPRELWMVILARVSESTENKLSFFRLCLVSSWWSKMVYESVTVLDDRYQYIGKFLKYLTEDALSRFVALQDLTLFGNYGDRHADDGTITNAGLRTATNLTRLDLSSVRWISDEGVAGLQKLTWLNLWDSHLTPGGLKLLTNLTHLTLGSRKHNFDEAIVHLSKLTFLHFGGCSSSNCTVSDNGLKGLSSLQYLCLRGDRYISDIGIQNLTKLETLSLSEAENRVTDDGVSKLVNLTSLDIFGNGSISDSGVSGLTKLTSLCISWANVGDNGIRNLINRTEFNIAGNGWVSDAGIAGLTNLMSLELDYLTLNVTDNGISNLVNLTELCLNDVITDAGISKLTKLWNLQLEKNILVTESCMKGLPNLW